MKLILFDVDGTIIDSQNIIVASLESAFASVGLAAPSRTEALSIVGLSLPHAFVPLVGSDGPVAELTAAFKSAFAGFRANAAIASPFFEGAQELIGLLGSRDDVMLGIATGKSRRGVNHILEKYDWWDLFATVQTADDAASKPHPEMIFRAMAETGIGQHDLVMIGDTTYDMEMAANAGVNSIGVAWGYHEVDALAALGAGAIVSSYEELGAVLDSFIAHGVISQEST